MEILTSSKSKAMSVMTRDMIKTMLVMIETMVVKVEVVAICMIKSIPMSSFLSTMLKAMEI